MWLPGRHFGSPLAWPHQQSCLAARWPLLRASRRSQAAVMRALRGGRGPCCRPVSVNLCLVHVSMLVDLGPGIPGVSTTQSLGLVVLRHLGMHPSSVPLTGPLLEQRAGVCFS